MGDGMVGLGPSGPACSVDWHGAPGIEWVMGMELGVLKKVKTGLEWVWEMEW